MIITAFDKIQQRRAEIYIYELILLLFIFRTAVPVFKYPFLLLSIPFVSYVLITRRRIIFKHSIDFLLVSYVIFLVALDFIISLTFTSKLYLVVFKDLMNMLILISLFIVLKVIVQSKEDLHIFISTLLRLIIYFAIFITVYRALEFLKVFSPEADLQAINYTEYLIFVNSLLNLFLEHLF